MTEITWDTREWKAWVSRALAVDKTVSATLRTEAEHVMTAAKADTPVDTGRLRASGHVEGPSRTSQGIEVTLAYGTDYAVYVHEIMGRHHPVGRAKFLESNVDMAWPRILAALNSAMEKL